MHSDNFPLGDFHLHRYFELSFTSPVPGERSATTNMSSGCTAVATTAAEVGKNNNLDTIFHRFDGSERRVSLGGIAIQNDEHHKELKARGLLDSNYSLPKKFISEQIIFGAAPLAAVLLQIAHPGVGKGVGNHSDFSNRVLERAHNTAMYMFTTLFGTSAEKAKMRKFVNRRHARVNDRRTDNSYNAFDPKLQLWVAATLYATYVPAHESVHGLLSQEERERALQEFSVLGTCLQVPLEMWPRSCGEFWSYWDYMVENELEITEPCRKVTDELFNLVENVPWTLRPFAAITGPFRQAGAIEMLPEKTRRQYGFQLNPSIERMNGVSLWMAQWWKPYEPQWMKDWLVKYYVDMFRQRMAEGKIF
jgi:uncharacterized protein (DUF2236 family)